MKRFLLVWLLCSCVSTLTAKEKTLRVMSFNLWSGGNGGGQALEQSANAIKAAKADVVGFQETHGLPATEPRPDNSKKIAEMLGWNYFDQGGRKAIISRFPIETNTPAKHGVTLRLPDGQRIFMFNVHFFHAPYQPYQLVGIPYAGGAFFKTEAEAIEAAQKTRGHEVEALLKELSVARMSGLPVFLTGDFNEPSHLDWNEAAAKAGKVPIKVEYPATLAITRSGMRDSYREVFPNVVKDRGNTWTPIKPENDPSERHDRIDFVFYSGDRVKVAKVQIVGENKKAADIVVQPYPSDHRAVVGTFTMERP